ncbi:hypothetical protein LTS18_012195 [Coniosporium uncinatum]|uniref:Uncharacterized protein n=1 Tax=Coniosporium uncinatum TaxID=93489 RepID=A0ACC3CXP1_9PEZI|nr:hypothetical protein LTS18_012195 [Coniosporium uncinatum]
MLSESSDATMGDLLPALQRQDRQLQEKLQMLIDSQVEGLMAGLQMHEAEKHASGNSTPTAQSFGAGSSSSVLSTQRHRVSLKAARLGIWRTMQELADIKSEEAGLFEEEVAEDNSILGRIERWERKQHGLEEEVQHIEDSSEGRRTRDLQHEADRLQVEITDMESRLSAMRLQHKHMVEEIASIDNSVQAKLSSYKASLDLLDHDVKAFLQRPHRKTRRRSSQSDFLSLPPSRRTLSLAKDHFQDEQSDWSRRLEEASIEYEALKDGAEVWKEIVSTITNFERTFKERMISPSAESKNASLQELLDRMDQIMEFLGEKYEEVESKNWKLLMCCIGAEKEAFVQGREMLQGIFRPIPNVKGPNGNLTPTKSQVLVGVKEEGSSSSTLTSSRSSDREKARREREARARAEVNLSTEDDEPDPDLLISHQDTDTD